MVLRNAQGVENKRKLKVLRKEGSHGDRSFIEFLYPNDIKGTKLLSFEVIGKDDKQWLYLPALKRIKRISSRNKSGSFAASEFSYEDISSVNYQNYTYSGEAEIDTKNGKSYFKIVRKPIDKYSGYSKQIIWIDKKDYLIRFGEYYDRHGKLLKKVHFSKYKKTEGVWRIFEIDIENIQNHKSSKLIWKSDKIHIPIKNTDVSKRVLY
ncbi:MAG: outer membrane lipoprotein-sorting protein [Sulfurovum sp.]|nr:outer membrane lipoprotein-sorting protein [Sulfurovum sp.]MCB4749702.1 outer membrane lipoprotein-sorting protein [Sulfurovum sp.]MCB4753390.1 outer membrane lipoprotein-sorting protein [Sulfurovum sp.]MCB4761921.1 outer membrane lipoprotein-sorting protein [Sulfurovum sp.]MCB4762818.1 outer membrane lipoprotein-sorting protein [Sulfurovum sp.]